MKTVELQHWNGTKWEPVRIKPSINIKPVTRPPGEDLREIHIIIRYPGVSGDPLAQHMSVGAKWRYENEDLQSDDAGDYVDMSDHFTPEEAIDMAKEVLKANGVID